MACLLMVSADNTYFKETSPGKLKPIGVHNTTPIYLFHKELPPNLQKYEQGWNPGQNRTGKTRVIPKTVNPSNSNQNPGWNRNRIQCFSRKKYAKKSILSVLNCKIMEFFKIIISIGILNSKIVPFLAKFEGHKLYWHDSYYQIHS